MEEVNLENAKQQYAGQWLAFLVTEETPAGELLGQIIAYCGKYPILTGGRVTEAGLKQGKRETPAKADPSPFPLCG